jgi:hypothetical protein
MVRQHMANTSNFANARRPWVQARAFSSELERNVAEGAMGSLAPIRAFTPVFDGLWGEGAHHAATGRARHR